MGDALSASEEIKGAAGGEGCGEEQQDKEGRVGTDVVDELHEGATQHLAYLQKQNPSRFDVRALYNDKVPHHHHPSSSISLTAKVVGAPQMILQPVFSQGPSLVHQS